MFVIAEAIIERRSGGFEPAGPSTALAFNVHTSVVMPLLENPVTLIEAFDGHRWDSPQKLGSHRTHRWREQDSNRRFREEGPDASCVGVPAPQALEGSGFEPSVPRDRTARLMASNLTSALTGSRRAG
jgi:hypothetical protein